MFSDGCLWCLLIGVCGDWCLVTAVFVCLVIGVVFSDGCLWCLVIGVFSDWCLW